ncbi:hypothetical protein, partial [Halorubrum halophilum]|uniref:hypothetical protein n=1 Tax=Halorubrum halophilum TaxID=413816 RepID=UPI001376BEBB
YGDSTQPIENNSITGWETPITLFENPASGDIDNGLITGNEIDSGYSGNYAIYAFEQNGDGFDDINGESETAAQETALRNDNNVANVKIVEGGSL